MPKAYKQGPKNQCFSTSIFWKWIVYGIFQSALVFFISFVTYNDTVSLPRGQTGDLWLEGTFAYGAIVILCNISILYGSFSHTLGSVAIILLSIASFFGVFWLFSFLGFTTLDGLFDEYISFPTTGLNLVFFFFITFPIDAFLYFRTQQKKEKVIT